MNKQLDSQTHLLKHSNEESINSEKKCMFCKQNFTIQKLQNYENDKCKTQFQAQTEEVEDNNFYYYLVLINEEVNIHQLKSFIEKNKIHLRQIIIQHCKFYQNDYLLNKQVEVGALRMLSEIDFNYMFEMFHFQNLSILELDMCQNNLLLGTTYSVRNEQMNKKLIKKDSAKIQPLSYNDKDMNLEQKKFIQQFDCDENCKMVEYEFGEKNKLYKHMTEDKSNSEEEMVRKLKWGELLDEDKFGQILLNNIISEIKFHLETYKSYTKYSFNQGILLILGDVLKNQLSLNQLQNLIKINLQFITGVIFKANKSIPEKSFNQLMQYFLQIPNLEMIGFFGSVLNTQNFEELHYLIEKKKVKYLVLYKSYFLINEINQIIKLKEKNFILNHQRYFILDLNFNEQYEFTPFSFAIQDLKKKQPNNLLEIEQVYLKQQEYPKNISSWINYFQGKNLSILHNNQSIKLLQKITDIDEQKSSQNEIYNLFEQLILTDDMHYINCQIFKQKCNLNSNFYNKLQDLLVSKKSYQATSQIFNVDVPRIFDTIRFWQISALSFIQGFSRIKSKNFNFLSQSQKNNPILGTYSFIKKKKQMSLNEFCQLYNEKTPQIFDKFYDNKTTIEIQIGQDIKSYDQVNNILQKFKKLQNMNISFLQDNGIVEQIQFEELINLQIQKLTFSTSFYNQDSNREYKCSKLLRYVLPKNTHLKSLKIEGIHFDFEKFSDSDHDFLKTIEKLSFNYCQFKNDKLLSNILQQTTQLKKLKVYNLKDEKNENIEVLNPEDIPKSVEILSIPPEVIKSTDQDFYVYVLMNLNSLKEIDLFSYKSNFENLEEHKLNLNSLETINLYSLDFNILKLLKWILKYSPSLKYFNLLVNQTNINSYIDGFKQLDLNNISNMDVKGQNEYNHHFQTLFNQIKSITLELNGIDFENQFTINSISKKITKLIVSCCKFESISFFQFIMQECDNLRNLKIQYTYIDEVINEKFDFSKLNIQDLQKFKFMKNRRFKNLGFPQEILKKYINNLKLIKFDKNSLHGDESDKLENSDFINLFVKKMKLEELYCNNDFSYDEICQMMEKKSQFFNITDFNLTHSWDDESIKNEEINFFKVFDTSNLTIFQQINKSSLLKNVENFLQIKDDQQNDLNKNKILNKYSKYHPINFYSTFNISNNITNQTQIFKMQHYSFNMDSSKILSNPQNNDIFQSLQILKLKNMQGKNNQQLINLIKRQQNLTELIINGFMYNYKEKQNFNDWNSLNLRKVIIKNCNIISFDLVKKIFQSQNLEELKIDNLQQLDYQEEDAKDDLNFSFASIKLRKFHFYSYYDDSKKIKQIINYFLPLCKQLEFFQFNMDINDFKFDNFGQNLQFFFSFSFKLKEEQVNCVFKKCQQLKVFEIIIELESSFQQIDFDLVSKYLKKLLILKGKGIVKSTSFFSDYFFENKIKSEGDIYQKDQLDLLSDTEENKNNMYLEITYHLIQNPSFKRFIQSKQIIGLQLQDFGYQDCQETSNFFNTYSLQLQNLKHLIIDNQVFYQIIYQNVNLNSNKLESLIIINQRFQYQQYSDIMAKILDSTLDNDNLLNIQNLCKKLKSLTLNYAIKTDHLNQILQNCKLLDYFYFIDYDYDNHFYDGDYDTYKKFNLDYSEVRIPQNVKSIVFNNFNLNAQNLINSDKMMYCDQLKILVLKAGSKYNQMRFENQINFKLDLKKISKNLEVLKIQSFLIDIEYFLQYFQSREQKLKRIDLYDLNNYNKYLKIMSVLDKIEDIKFKLNISISNDQQSQEEDQVILFPQLVQQLLGIFILIKFSFYFTNQQVYQIFNYFQMFQRDLILKVINELYFVILNIYKQIIFNIGLFLKKLSIFLFCLSDQFSNQFQRIIYLITYIFFQIYLKLKYKNIYYFFIELKHQNIDYTYDLAIQYFGYLVDSTQFREQIIQYLYFYLNSDFLIQDQLFYPFLIYSPFLLFQKTQNIQNVKQNYIKENNLNMIEKTIHLLNKHQKYIFGFDQDTFNQYSNIPENLLNEQSQIEFLKDISSKIKLLDCYNIYIPYECSIDKKELERLQLNDIIPPKKLKMSDMSIQFVKSWYAINYYAPLTTETIIDNYDNSQIENNSIANLIQKRAFKNILSLNKRPDSNFLMKKLNKIRLNIYNLLYVVFNQLNSEPKIFKMDHSVLHLEVYFAKKFKAKYHFLIRFLYIIYLFVCAFGIWYFSFETTLQCGASLSKYSFIMYFCFGFITFIVEAFFFQKFLNFVSHLIPQIKPDCDIGFPKAQINQIKKFIIDIPWLNHQYVNYSITFLLSQLSRFDFFTNIGFLYTTYSCKNYIIFYCALASIGSITIINLLVFFIAKNLFGNKEKSKLVTGHIDIFYQICNLLSFLAVADILDIISPSNCVVVKGKMYNQRIIGHFFKILLQDLPLIVLQALQLVSQKQINETVVLSIILSCIMFLVSLTKFITLTPSTISQKEFDVLNKMKKEKAMPAYLELLSDYESKLQKYNIYEQLKCLKSKEYLLKQIENKFKKDNKILTEEEKNKQLRIQEKLRTCTVNQKSIEEIFGNTRFN